MAVTTPSNPALVDVHLIKKSVLHYRALNHKLRQQILALIHKNGRIAVTPIYKKLKLEQSVASQHLAILRRSGMVTTTREGKHIYYSVNYKRIEKVHDIAEQMLHA